MKENILEKTSTVFNLEFYTKKIVEGFISGLHKSPFHGFSTEFSERRPYNNGENTRFLDWKYFAKTDKKFIKKYEEETNLRCHIILDVSASMYYPRPLSKNLEKSKIGFATLLSAIFMQIMAKQRDAIGLSMFSDKIDFYSKEKTNRKHFKNLLGKLETNFFNDKKNKATNIFNSLHNLAERFHKRSLIVIISDFVDSEKHTHELFEALKHLSFNKHEIILFHIVDEKTELDLVFDDNYLKIEDLETGNNILLNTREAKEEFLKKTKKHTELLKINSLQYKMDYKIIDIKSGFDTAIINYLNKRKKIF